MASRFWVHHLLPPYAPRGTDAAGLTGQAGDLDKGPPESDRYAGHGWSFGADRRSPDKLWGWNGLSRLRR